MEYYVWLLCPEIIRRDPSRAGGWMEYYVGLLCPEILRRDPLRAEGWMEYPIKYYSSVSRGLRETKAAI